MMNQDNGSSGGGTGKPDLQLVPESVLKRKHDLDTMKAHRAAQAVSHPRGNRNVFSNKTKVVKVIKPEKFVARGRSRRNHGLRYGRVQKKGMQGRASDRRQVKNVVVAAKEAEGDGEGASASAVVVPGIEVATNSVGANVVFAIRIRDGAGIHRSVNKVLSRLRLRNVNEGVFLRYNESTRKMLHLVEPWVTYGVPSKSVITDLINRRGHGRVEGKRIPLTDNTIIEKVLGEETGIICVEDLVHEIHHSGGSGGDGDGVNASKAALSFLWPFRLAAPRSKFQKEKLNKKDGGRDEYGDRGEEMDSLIRQML